MNDTAARDRLPEVVGGIDNQVAPADDPCVVDGMHKERGEVDTLTLAEAIALLEARHASLIRQATTANLAVGRRLSAIRDVRANGGDLRGAELAYEEATRWYRSQADRADEAEYALSVMRRVVGASASDEALPFLTVITVTKDGVA